MRVDHTIDIYLEHHFLFPLCNLIYLMRILEGMKFSMSHLTFFDNAQKLLSPEYSVRERDTLSMIFSIINWILEIYKDLSGQLLFFNTRKPIGYAPINREDTLG